MRFYGANLNEVMNMPIRTFWFMNTCVDRLRAEEDMRQLSIASSAQSSDGYERKQESLNLQIGEVVKYDPIISAVRDQEGFDELRGLEDVN